MVADRLTAEATESRARCRERAAELLRDVEALCAAGRGAEEGTKAKLAEAGALLDTSELLLRIARPRQPERGLAGADLVTEAERRPRRHG